MAADPAPTLSSDDEDDAQDLMHLPVIIHRQEAPRPPQEGCASKDCDTQTALEKMYAFASCLMHASHRPQAGGRAVAPGRIAICKISSQEDHVLATGSGPLPCISKSMLSSCAFLFAFTGRAVAGSLRQSACLGTGEYMLTACTYALASTPQRDSSWRQSVGSLPGRR